MQNFKVEKKVLDFCWGQRKKQKLIWKKFLRMDGPLKYLCANFLFFIWYLKEAGLPKITSYELPLTSLSQSI